MADHVDAEDSFSLSIPIYSYLLGADHLEKHFCIKRKKSPFDRFSSIEPKEIEKFIEMIKKLNLSFGNNFINKSEKKYLDASIQKPVSRQFLKNSMLIRTLNSKEQNKMDWIL